MKQYRLEKTGTDGKERTEGITDAVKVFTLGHGLTMIHMLVEQMNLLIAQPGGKTQLPDGAMTAYRFQVMKIHKGNST